VKNIFIGLLLGALFAFPAFAEENTSNYIFLASSPNLKVYGIPGTLVSKEDNVIEFWTYEVFSNVELVMRFFPKLSRKEAANFAYYKALNQINCKTRMIRYLTTTYYDHDGSALYIEPEVKWKYITPNTIADGVSRLCPANIK